MVIIIKIIMTLITMTSRRNNMEIKDTLDWTRNWSSKFAWKHFIKYHKHYKEKIKTTTERKKKKTIGHVAPSLDHYPRNGLKVDTDRYSDMPH